MALTKTKKERISVVKGYKESFLLTTCYFFPRIITIYWSLIINSFLLVICSSCDYLPKSSVFILYRQGSRTWLSFSIRLLLGKITSFIPLSQVLYTSLLILCFHVPLNYILLEINFLARLTPLNLHHFFPFPKSIYL